MEVLSVERMDQLGVIAGVIKDLHLIEKIDARFPQSETESISTGEAIAGMVMSGLGFSDSPMSLTPEFFKDKPLDRLFRVGVKADEFNRFKLGRSLDKVFDYGCDILFSELALEACQSEGVDTSQCHLDTTTFSLSGQYLPDSDEQEIEIVYGYSKAKRPDLKQAVLEMMVSSDGRVPMVSKSWSGNESDSKIFQKRLAALASEMSKGEPPSLLVADSKLYSKDNASFFNQISFLTRIPNIIKLTQQLIKQALSDRSSWQDLMDGYRGYQVALSHYGVEQYWSVIYSEDAHHRAEKSMERKLEKEKGQIEKQIKKLKGQSFNCQKDAEKATKLLSKKWKYHRQEEVQYQEKKRYAHSGKPNADTPVKAIEWQVLVKYQRDPKLVDAQIERESCFVLGTSWSPAEVSMQELLDKYKTQDSVERGFRFLKDPKFFVSSLFLKKPSRIQGLLMVMSLALLVYTIAERRLRKALKEQGDTLPNQIKQPTATPTLRWVFQLLRGINLVTIRLGDTDHTSYQGITDLHRKIFSLLGDSVQKLYSVSEKEACSM